MKPRSSSTARIAAASALVLGLIMVIVVIGSAGGGSSSDSGKRHHHGAAQKTAKKQHAPASYEVQSGDTLISIAHKTGVPVREIEALNPEVDPQILIAGEELKLR
jgi:LysM repeat protein